MRDRPTVEHTGETACAQMTLDLISEDIGQTPSGQGSIEDKVAIVEDQSPLYLTENG